jgi:hypothetical protein
MSLCLVVIDTRDGRVAAQATVQARTGGVAIPPAIVRDAPVWIRDAAVDTQVRACRDARIGDKADAGFLAALPVAARVASATEHYGAGRLAAARTELRAALALPGGRRADVLSGLYLTEWRLKRSKEAEQVFGDLVAHGMATRRMGLLLPFKADGAELPAGKQLTQPLPMWWKQIAQRVPQKGGTCLDISGHASSGSGDDAGEGLSFRRAFVVRTQLIERVPHLRHGHGCQRPGHPSAAGGQRRQRRQRRPGPPHRADTEGLLKRSGRARCGLSGPAASLVRSAPARAAAHPGSADPTSHAAQRRRCCRRGHR